MNMKILAVVKSPSIYYSVYDKEEQKQKFQKIARGK